ncbi:hypothetical protein niasHT_033028 [Heterodera trifolii]|uniref:Fibronectin type-III domain-containing protein n=1 Tax=Heterodera trifolii TaxID=157864 RepID=A0ABD2IEW5_9BILA
MVDLLPNPSRGRWKGCHSTTIRCYQLSRAGFRDPVLLRSNLRRLSPPPPTDKLYDVSSAVDRPLIQFDFNALLPDRTPDDSAASSGDKFGRGRTHSTLGFITQLVSFDFGPPQSVDGNRTALGSLLALDSNGQLYATLFPFNGIGPCAAPKGPLPLFGFSASSQHRLLCSALDLLHIRHPFGVQNFSLWAMASEDGLLTHFILPMVLSVGTLTLGGRIAANANVLSPSFELFAIDSVDIGKTICRHAPRDSKTTTTPMLKAISRLQKMEFCEHCAYLVVGQRDVFRVELTALADHLWHQCTIKSNANKTKAKGEVNRSSSNVQQLLMFADSGESPSIGSVVCVQAPIGTDVDDGIDENRQQKQRRDLLIAAECSFGTKMGRKSAFLATLASCLPSSSFSANLQHQQQQSTMQKGPKVAANFNKKPLLADDVRAFLAQHQAGSAAQQHLPRGRQIERKNEARKRLNSEGRSANRKGYTVAELRSKSLVAMPKHNAQPPRLPPKQLLCLEDLPKTTQNVFCPWCALSCKSHRSLSIHSRIHFVPAWLNHDDMLNLVVRAGQTAEWKVKFGGKPAPKVAWSKNQRPINPKTSEPIQVHTKTNDHTTLRIPAAVRADRGAFTLLVRNSKGMDTKTAHLTVLGKPSKPRVPLEVNDVTEYGCVLRWTAPEDDGGLPIDHYEVEKLEGGKWMPCAKVSDCVAQVKELKKGQQYQFRVKAVNKEGKSEELCTEHEIVTKNQYADSGKNPNGTDSVTVTERTASGSGRRRVGSTAADRPTQAAAAAACAAGEVDNNEKGRQDMVVVTKKMATILVLAEPAKYHFSVSSQLDKPVVRDFGRPLNKFVEKLYDQQVYEMDDVNLHCKTTDKRTPAQWFRNGTLISSMPGSKYQCQSLSGEHTMKISKIEMNEGDKYEIAVGGLRGACRITVLEAERKPVTWGLFQLTSSQRLDVIYLTNFDFSHWRIFFRIDQI